jgi:hypothetical protein
VPSDASPDHSAPAAPDEAHRRPEGADDATVEAVGKISEALEWIERARGRLYDFHQMIGRADFLLEDGAQMLEGSGATELAEAVRVEAIGRNVLDGRWTFQIVEEFEDVYHRHLRALDDRVRDELMNGRRHVYEAELKERRRTPHQRAHESRPPRRHLDDA